MQGAAEHTFGALHAFVRSDVWARASDRVKALTKIHVIDGVGAMLAGHGTAPATLRAKCLFEAPAGGQDDSASFRECASRAHDYALCGRLSALDDVQTTETGTFGLLGHPTVPVLAAVLATGSLTRASGGAMLDAFLAGVEVSARLAAAAEVDELVSRSSATATFGGIGASFAAGKLLGLDREHAHAALNLWHSLAPTTPLPHETLSDTASRDAQSVRIAVQAALDAKNGLRGHPGSPAALEAPGMNSPSSILRRLGKPFWILEPGFAIRVYPSDPLSHPVIDAMLAIVNVHAIDAAEIETVEVGVTRVMMDRLTLTAPATLGDTRRSLPLAVALAACRGTVEAQDFERLPDDAAVVSLMPRVRVRVDPELDALGHERARCWVAVTVRGGRSIGLKLEVAKGTPQKPLSEVELAHKFVQCALRSLEEKAAEALLNRLWDLDNEADGSALFRA